MLPIQWYPITKWLLSKLVIGVFKPSISNLLLCVWQWVMTVIVKKIILLNIFTIYFTFWKANSDSAMCTYVFLLYMELFGIKFTWFSNMRNTICAWNLAYAFQLHMKGSVHKRLDIFFRLPLLWQILFAHFKPKWRSLAQWRDTYNL
jgi:hypothetical protein